MDNQKTSRRDFCTQAISLVTIASLVEGCGGGDGSPTSPGGGGSTVGTALPIINATAGGGVVTINNVDGTALAGIPSAAFIQSSDQRKFLVARTAQNSFSAVTAICTHEGCDVNRINGSTYVCPCHGSQYSSSGAVQSGPATRNLQSFATQFTNNVLTITA
jgi:Rieske Fe-S protein